ncbi:MAG: N-acetylmuramoyl-L-alanine amidase [Aureispira sp.]|nr:N-acetylmuramoyl-L-alanine amidase [Aureispira sp.]
MVEYSEPSSQTMRVVIDAGHGGKDPGSLGKKAKEKDISLKIALKVGAYIKTYMSGVKVIYTRTTDKFLPLHERARIANDNDADVFLSIHCNSTLPNRKHINGTETYVMGLHRAEDNLLVAKRENEVILLEDNYKSQYGGYDPNSPEGHIMLSMYQNAYLSQSILLAEKIEGQFKSRANRNSRGVKQAGFAVLRATTMPSVLVETGFLSNSTEEAYLSTDKGQVYIASAIYRAFKDYKSAVDKGGLVSKPSRSSSSSSSGTIGSTSSSKTSSISKTGVVYRVQLASSPSPIDTKSGRWKKVSTIERFKISGAYKYYSGKYSNLSGAVSHQKVIRQSGFSDAFIVPFKNGVKISLSEAKRLTE